MKKNTLFFIGISACLLLMGSVMRVPLSPAVGHPPLAQAGRNLSEEIQWVSFKEAQRKNQETPKKLFVDLYTTWCGWCKVLDERTYSQQQVIDYLNEHFYSVKFNAEQKEQVTFNGQVFEYVGSGRSGVHELASALTEGHLSYPTLVFMDEKLRPITYTAGFKDADELLDILVYLKEDHHLNKALTFETFKEKRETARKTK